jgi:hypothetical protein
VDGLGGGYSQGVFGAWRTDCAKVVGGVGEGPGARTPFGYIFGLTAPTLLHPALYNRSTFPG